LTHIPCILHNVAFASDNGNSRPYLYRVLEEVLNFHFSPSQGGHIYTPASSWIHYTEYTIPQLIEEADIARTFGNQYRPNIPCKQNLIVACCPTGKQKELCQ